MVRVVSTQFVTREERCAIPTMFGGHIDPEEIARQTKLETEIRRNAAKREYMKKYRQRAKARKEVGTVGSQLHTDRPKGGDK
jgi:hypothetical protein